MAHVLSMYVCMYVQERREDMARDRGIFEKSLLEHNAKVALAVDARLEELNKFLEKKKADCQVGR